MRWGDVDHTLHEVKARVTTVNHITTGTIWCPSEGKMPLLKVTNPDAHVSFTEACEVELLEPEEIEEVDYEILLTKKEVRLIVECIKKCRNRIRREIINNPKVSPEMIAQGHAKIERLSDLWEVVHGQRKEQEREARNEVA